MKEPELVIVTPVDQRPELDTEKVPGHAQDTLARALLAAITREFQRPEVQEDYRRWRKARGLS